MDLLVGGPTLVSAVRWEPTVTSTNELVAAAGQAGTPEGLVVVADRQTAGRGRRGRSWEAPAGTSLMLSVLLRPSLPPAPLPPTSWPLLPLMTGTAVVEACRAVVPGLAGRVGLKWPNDLLVEGVKAAGILVESAGDHVVVGVGINVDWRGVQRPDGLLATSLAEAVDGPVDRWALLEALLVRLDAGYRLAGLDPGGVVRRYVPDCVTLGVAVTAHGAAPVTGTAVGLTPDGHLRIRDEDGRDHVVTAGDVEHLR